MKIKTIFKNLYRKVRVKLIRIQKTVIDKPDLSNKLCAVPWMHLNFEPNGKVVPCCLTSTYNYFAGDLTKQRIDEIWNSGNMKDLRIQMMNNVEPEICRKCYDKERVTGESGRTYHNLEFKSVLKQIPIITKPDGTCTKMELKYWDFRFSNLCNLKCRSCGPRYSSAWVPDAKKLGHSDQEKVWNIESVGTSTNFNFLKEQVEHVEKIYFAGGEPLLMPEHWQILDLLVQNKRFDVKLSYNTNCTTLTYGKKNIVDYWGQWEFGKLEVWPSLDEIDERAELVRSGTDWKKVEENLKELNQLDNLILRPGITVGVFNVFRLPQIINRLVELKVINEKQWYKNFFINLLEDPKHYHVHVLPDDYRQTIIQHLNNFVDDYNKKYSTDIRPHFKQILFELTKPYNSKAAKDFLRVTGEVDRIRNEDTFATIPELHIIRMAYPSIYEAAKNI